jgi:2-polyprenyl-6-methoxyphenol hydroxylase-like FAD-dependent oxidoreductase
MTSTLIGKQAVVVGAGMAGLPAARALADYFEHVVVLERDTLPRDAAQRAGTPQARHTHGLLAGGQRALGELFPGFEQDLAGAGAVPVRVGLDLRLEMPGFDPFPRRDLGVIAYAMSRPLIEFTARQRVRRHANITIRENCRAQGVVAAPGRTSVSAVRFENKNGETETLAADLIVEASGRGNLTFGLLESTGQPMPEETVIGVDIGYATAVLSIPENAPAGWTAVMTFDRQPRAASPA